MMKVGDLFNLSHGEYSDYSIINTMKALKDFTMLDVKTAVKESGECRDEYGWDDDCINIEAVTDYMIKYGYCEKIQCEEMHLGSYSSFDPREGY
jgi:hypothetical protein